MSLTPSGQVVVAGNDEVIENLEITVTGTDHGVVLTNFTGVILRNCKINHEHGAGIHAENDFSNLLIQDVDFVCTGQPAAGAHATEDNMINIDLVGDVDVPTGVIIRRVRLTRGCSGIYARFTDGILCEYIEGYDFRGPFPRGQLAQFHACVSPILQDFSCINYGDRSWTEDNVNCYACTTPIIRRGLIIGNNSPSGVGVLIENSDGGTGGTVEDVDVLYWANGAFSAADDSENVTFTRCRARDGMAAAAASSPVNSSAGETDYLGNIIPTFDDYLGSLYAARAADSSPDPPDPLSGGEPFVAFLSVGSIAYVDCEYFNLPRSPNLFFEDDLMTSMDATEVDFVPRSAITLVMPWEAGSIDTGFPQIEATEETTFAVAATSHPVLLPPTILPGRLILIRLVTDQVEAQTAPGEWEPIRTNSFDGTSTNDLRSNLYGKVAVGDEGGTTVDITTVGAQEGCGIAWVITDWDGNIANGVQADVSFTGASGQADPPSLTAAWGVLKNLWMASRSQRSITEVAYPTNYGLNPVFVTDGAVVCCQVGTRELEDATANPGDFGTGGNGFIAHTVVIKPITQGQVAATLPALTASGTSIQNPAGIAAVTLPSLTASGVSKREPSVADIIAVSAQFHPLTDAGVAGGGPDATMEVVFVDLASADDIEIVSNHALDTYQTVTVAGRQADGTQVIESKQLNGTTPVIFSNAGILTSLLRVQLSAFARGDITVRRSVAGATVKVIPTGRLGFRKLFANSFSTGSLAAKPYYEKFFIYNSGFGVFSAGAVIEASDPQARFTFTLDAIKNSSSETVNRLTPPAAIYTDPDTFDANSKNIPGILEAGEGIGVWIEFLAHAGGDVFNDVYALTLTGNLLNEEQ